MGIDNKNKISSQYSDADEEYIFIMGLETLPSTCYILSENFLYTLY